MADEVSNKPGPFDVNTIKALVQLMARHEMNEIDLRDGDVRVRLLRGVQAQAPVHHDSVPGATAAVPAAAPAAAVPKEAAAPAVPRKLLEIKSPSVGTFYAARDPADPPLVRVGDRVGPTTVVGLLEAMKLYNEITADCSGMIEEVVVPNGKAVEFGELLFRVNPAG